MILLLLSVAAVGVDAYRRRVEVDTGGGFARRRDRTSIQRQLVEVNQPLQAQPNVETFVSVFFFICSR